MEQLIRNKMENFEYYLKNNKIRKVTKDIILAKSLINDIKIRIKENWDEDINKKPKTIFENIYDSLQDFCNALLSLDGFKSYSHEASISYLQKKGFDIAIIEKFDKLRYIRNGSKYYGRIITSEDAKDIKSFYLKIRERINKLLKENNLY
jgi:oligoribonuclease NrnB/cAMP/cGMP phosphodiesterase (DHH superfamily)